MFLLRFKSDFVRLNAIAHTTVMAVLIMGRGVQPNIEKSSGANISRMVGNTKKEGDKKDD